MKNKQFLFLLIITLLLFTSCKERHSKAIDLAYQLTATAPDSALSILHGVKQDKLSKSEKARYALVYTIAQDKSGLDVDNDSLLRTAYAYYNKRPDDSLYAKCQYYMGKYYMLNDSTELAIDCLQKSSDAAEKQSDKYTKSLALEKLSTVIRQTNPQKAVRIAKLAEKTYSDFPKPSKQNIVYLKLNVCEALSMADSIQQAFNECQVAIDLALKTGDSTVISDAYQDMSSILDVKKEYQQSLYYSKKSFELSKNQDISKILNLASAYLDVDSLKECENLLTNIKTNDLLSLYTAYYIRQIAAIKGQKPDKAIMYADSSCYYIEKKCNKELNAKEKYYNSLVKVQHDNGINEGRAQIMTWLIIVTVIVAIIIVLFILYSYRQYKFKTKLEIQNEQKERKKDQELADEELKHREIQLSTMRNFILKRIDTAQKVQELRGNKTDNVLLTEEDWEEIRIFVDGVEGNFVSRLLSKFPNLSMDDIRLMMLIRLKIPTKALALIYGINEKSIRQKLFVYKSKVGISGEKMSLRSFIEEF